MSRMLRATLVSLGLLLGLTSVHAKGPVAIDIELIDEARKSVTLDNRLTLGASATLRLTVTAPLDAEVFIPQNPALDGVFRVTSTPAPAQRRLAGSSRVEVLEVPLVAVRMGSKAIPPIEVAYRLPDGTEAVVSTPRTRVVIEGRLTDVQEPKGGAPPPPVPVIGPDWVAVYSVTILGAALTAALLTLLTLFFLRAYLEALKPPPPPRPANEVAYESLERLTHEPLTALERYAAFVDVLRVYLGARYEFDGMESTTRELSISLAQPELKGVTLSEVMAVFEDADLVKFAGLTPSDDEGDALVPVIRRIVDLTWEEPTVEETADERVMEPAPPQIRLRAAVVDTVLACGLGAALTGGVWLMGYPEHAWLGVVMAGLLLFTRDVVGPGSPGKALLGLRVVSADALQTTPSGSRRLLRNALLLVAPVGLMVESLVLIHHPLSRRVGDGWARTQVVEDPLAGQRAQQRRHTLASSSEGGV